ncbi:MAG TPA: VOC family protein [Thermoanaerobaculia bacterium]|nr:VOC family protein [Thermoanaerobaculia bacterium]
MTDASDLAQARIGQIAINARDLPRAVAFYRDTLGLRFLFEVPGMAFFDCGGIRLLVGTAVRPELDHPSSILYFRVADIRATHAELKSRGANFLNEPHRVARMPDHELWLAEFQDSEGSTLALMSEIR